ncbi:hypothetical protein HK102_001369 [Quaeritorhiza haematococci]|nr:hypothetical protein HK102_001369 [Quaeritorhiza haematococci]
MNLDSESSGSLLTQLQHQLQSDTPEDIGSATASMEAIQYEQDVTAEVEVEGETEVEESTPAPPAKQIDLANEELFPALPSAGPARPAFGAWGAGKASGGSAAATAAASAAARGRGAAAGTGAARSPARSGSGALPAHITERFDIPLQHQAKQQQQLGGKSTIADICKQIKERTHTSIELSTAKKTGTLTFLVTGKAENVKQARREIQNAVCIHVTQTIHVPAAVRPHILGAGGRNLKALTARTMTKVNIPRQNQENAAAAGGEEDAENVDDEQPVVITGDVQGVEMAKQEIEALVAQRTSRQTIRLSIERSYHPFIAGPNNSQVQLIQLETNCRIHIPPMVPPPSVTSSSSSLNGGAASTESGQQKNLNEIIIVGERPGVQAAEERVREIYEDLRRTTRTLQFPVKKRQHRFIIGPKGSVLQEILQKTGCYVELPLHSDPSDMVTIRGPDTMLSTALNMVIEKSNATSIEEVDIVASIPKTTDPSLFLRYLYTKERAALKAIESANGATILSQTNSMTGHQILEIQAKSRGEVEQARTALATMVKDLGASLFFGCVEIPRGLHKFVVGKQGSNIAKMKSKPEWNGRLVDVVVPNESDESDEVVIVVRRNAPTASTPAAAKAVEKEAQTLVEKVKEEIISVATALADFVTRVINIDPKYHGRLIGSGGSTLKEMLAPYNGAVSVKFPPSTGGAHASAAKASADGDKESNNAKQVVNPSAVTVKGPQKEVADAIDKIQKMVAEWRHIEVMNSFEEVVRLPKGIGRKLIGLGANHQGPAVAGLGAPPASAANIGWLVRTLKDELAAKEAAHQASKVSEKDMQSANLNMRVEISDGSDATEDVLTVIGPKHVVEMARRVLEERAKRLGEVASVEVRLFEEVGKEAKELLAKDGPAADMRKKVMRRIIGKEGKVVKRVCEKYGVWVKFPDRAGGNKKGGHAAAEADEVALEASDAPVPDGVVVVRGGKKDVESAKQELLELVEYEILHSCTINFVVPKRTLPHIVGRNGTKVMKMKEECDVRIDFKDLEVAEGEEEAQEVEVAIEGTRAGCAEAKSRILEIVDDMVNTESINLIIPFYLHKQIIGPSGSRIKKVIEAFGGPDKVKVQFPKVGGDADASQDTVVLKANKRVLPELKKELEKILAEVLGGSSGSDERPASPGKKGGKAKGGQQGEVESILDGEQVAVVEEILKVPRAEIPRIVGRGGEGLKEVMRKFGVSVWVAEKGTEQDDDGDETAVRIVGRRGKEKDVEAARDEIASKLRVAEKVPIPEKFLQQIASVTGAMRDVEISQLQEIVKRVRGEFGAYADVSINKKDPSNGSITVRGEQRVVEAAAKLVKKSLEDLANVESTVHVSIDSEIRPHIIGRGGATINRIRAETGCQVDVVRGSGENKTDVVVIRGSEEGTTNAKKLVEDIVKAQETRNQRDQQRRAQQQQQQLEAQQAQMERTQSTGSGSGYVARIDDDAHSDAGSSVADLDGHRTVPGWSGRSNQRVGATTTSRRKKKAGPSVNSEGTTTPAAQGEVSPSSIVGSDATAVSHPASAVGALAESRFYAFQPTAAISKEEQQWQSVKSRKGKGKGGEEAPAAAVPGASGEDGSASKNKKKKKKASAATAAANATVPGTAPASGVPATPAKVEHAQVTGSADVVVQKPAERAPSPGRRPPSPVKSTPAPATEKDAASEFTTVTSGKGAKAKKSNTQSASTPAPTAAKQAPKAPATNTQTKQPSVPAPTAAPAAIAPGFNPADYEDFEVAVPAAGDAEWTTVTNSVKKYKQQKLASQQEQQPHTQPSQQTTGVPLPASLAAAAAALGLAEEGSGGAKKKKNKKKKKKGTGGAPSANGVDGEESD